MPQMAFHRLLVLSKRNTTTKGEKEETDLVNLQKRGI